MREVFAENEIVSPTDGEALDASSQKAALEEFSHSLVLTTADLEVFTGNEVVSPTDGEALDAVHKKLHSRNSTTRLF